MLERHRSRVSISGREWVGAVVLALRRAEGKHNGIEMTLVLDVGNVEMQERQEAVLLASRRFQLWVPRRCRHSLCAC